MDTLMGILRAAICLHLDMSKAPKPSGAELESVEKHNQKNILWGSGSVPDMFMSNGEYTRVGFNGTK